jgi:tRNA(Ile)-lysidine synthase
MNADAAHRRAAVRGRVVPVLEEVLGPGAVPALARTARLLRDDADLLDALAADLLAAAVTGASPGERVLDVAALADAPPALRRRALRAAAAAAGCPPGDLAAAHVDALEALVGDWHGQGAVALPGGVAGSRRYGRLSLRRSAAPDGPARSTGR